MTLVNGQSNNFDSLGKAVINEESAQRSQWNMWVRLGKNWVENLEDKYSGYYIFATTIGSFDGNNVYAWPDDANVDSNDTFDQPNPGADLAY